MSGPPVNIFSAVEQFSEILGVQNLLEARFENDANNNPIYIGYSPIPNADPSLPVWFILKVEYVDQGITRKRLPDDGVKFSYVWNDMSTYFS